MMPIGGGYKVANSLGAELKNDTVSAVANEIKKIPIELRERESGLYRTRWFDYRRMMPSRATAEFARTYGRIYREQYAKTQDLNAARDINAYAIGDDIFASPFLIHFWRARQEADRYGCRYEYYIRFVFNRSLERGWRYIPAPNQLASEEISLDLEVAWLETKRKILQLSLNDLYRIENYKGLPEQDAYRQYLVQQVLARSVQDKILARLVYKERMLPLATVMDHFGPDVAGRVSFAQNLQ